MERPEANHIPFAVATALAAGAALFSPGHVEADGPTPTPIAGNTISPSNLPDNCTIENNLVVCTVNGDSEIADELNSLKWVAIAGLAIWVFIKD